MADFETLPSGELDDRVRVVFKGFETRVFESYTVRLAVLQQPAVFSVKLGGVEPPHEIFKRYPPGTPFELAIGPQPSFKGYTDGYESSGDANQGTYVVLMGRDILARLQDAEFRSDKTFTDVTYADLVYEVMLEAGGLDEAAIISSNESNVIVRAGVGVTTKPGTPPKPLREGGGPTPTGSPGADAIAGGVDGAIRSATVGGKPGTHTVHARAGEKCLDWLKKHLDKAGVMVWTDTNGDIVVSAPNTDQKPKYHFVRQRGQKRNAVNVTSHSFKNDTTKRLSSVIVYGRGPGKKKGKGKIKGEFVDADMVAMGILKTRTFRDANVFDEPQAVKYAQAKMAEINRASWSLTYVIEGHTAPVYGDVTKRAVVTVDTMAQIQDDELGISGLFYIEAVEYTSPPSTTKITFMRAQDCFFEKDPTIVEQVESTKAATKRRRRRKS